MKEEGIKIRINSALKNEFKNICNQESVTMSDSVHSFIVNKVKLNQVKCLEDNFKEMIRQMGYCSVYVVGSTSFFWNNEEKKTSLNEEVCDWVVLLSYNMNILDFLKENKNKMVLIYLNGCDFSKNKIKAYAF